MMNSGIDLSSLKKIKNPGGRIKEKTRGGPGGGGRGAFSDIFSNLAMLYLSFLW